MKICELDLIKLGFDKVVVSPEDAGTDLGYYYYEYSLSETNDDFCLISMESDKITDDKWFVKLFEVSDYVFEDREDLKEFIQNVVKCKRSLFVS